VPAICQSFDRRRASDPRIGAESSEHRINVLGATEATIPQLTIQLAQATNALSVLIGMSPAPLDDLLTGSSDIPSAPDKVVVGIPANFLRRRPDVRRAELGAPTQSAQINVTKADLFPTLTLAGSVGTLASDINPSTLGEVFTRGSLTYGAGPAAQWSILNYGQITNNVRVQDAKLQALLIDYRDAVLKAQQEVEDGIATSIARHGGLRRDARLDSAGDTVRAGLLSRDATRRCTTRSRRARPAARSSFRRASRMDADGVGCTLGSRMTRPEISLGPARRSDAVEIAYMSRHLIEGGLRWAWTPRRVAASVASPNAIVVVARGEDRIAGFGIMRYGDDEAHLDLLGVGPDRRREGIGRRLVEWLEKPALVAGISVVFLEVRASNHGAQAFYERLGYRRLTEIPRYYQGRESAVRMGRELGCPVQCESFVWRI
jgi:ribosomal protein S18 acetylase RimI-like enzyme